MGADGTSYALMRFRHAATSLTWVTVRLIRFAIIQFEDDEG